MNVKSTTPKIEAFKMRIYNMCDSIRLMEVPSSRPARTLFIGKDQVGLGDCTMGVTTEEMNEILRYIIKDRFL